MSVVEGFPNDVRVSIEGIGPAAVRVFAAEDNEQDVGMTDQSTTRDRTETPSRCRVNFSHARSREADREANAFYTSRVIAVTRREGNMKSKRSKHLFIFLLVKG